MSFVNFNIPVYVRNEINNEQTSFVLRPLFLDYPVGNGLRFEQAVTNFKKELRRNLNNVRVDPDNLEQLMWYRFDPILESQQIPLQIPLGKTLFNGTFTIITFTLKDIRFACLPDLGNHLFMVPFGKKNDIVLQEQTSKVIAKLFKNWRRDDDGQFDPVKYTTDKKSFITHIGISLNIRSAGFAFEKQSTLPFFQKMQSDSDFDGAVEIEKVAENLNNRYPEDLKRSYFREALVNRLSRIIYQTENVPFVLIGPEGIGKQTVLHEVVFQYLKNKENLKIEKESLFAKIWQIDPTRVVSGMSIIGWWEKRVESIIQFVINKKKGEKDKLLFTNAVALIRVGKNASNDLALSDILRPYLEKRKLQAILLATPEEWKVVQEKDRRFSDLFQVVRIQEPDVPTAARMVLQQRKHLELEQGCTFSISAIQQLFYFQRTFLRRKALPGSVMKLMNQLASKYRYQYIDVPEVEEELDTISGRSTPLFDMGHVFEKDEIKQRVSRQLVGQAAAVDALSDTIHLLKAKLNNPDKPVSSFLFIGPTGVGKTQAAKVLVQEIMGTEDALIRFDMNEYIDAGASARLIGDYNNPEGQLTGKVRYQPFGVLLLDEIEKANPSVHDLLLQVLDDGRLTDSLGRTIDFTNIIIIMTSNIGASAIDQQLGFDTASRDDSAIYKKAVENFFRPEFINRIDRIVIFNALEQQHILNIAKLQIRELLSRDGFVRRTTILNITEEALTWVAKRGYDSRMGGRALKRQIEKDLTALSAEQLISTDSEHPIILEIDLKGDRLVPLIHLLAFAEALPEGWLPELPSEEKGRGFFNRLIRRIESIERKVKQLEEKDRAQSDDVIVIDGSDQGKGLDWQYYDFKERIASLKQQLTTLSLGFRDKYFKEGPAIPLRLKNTTIVTRRTEAYAKHFRNQSRDRILQMEALQEVKESYQYAAGIFNSIQTEFIENMLDVSFLEIASSDFLKGQSSKVTLSFKSFIQRRGKTEIQYLTQIYRQLISALNLSFQFDKKKNEIIVEGHGAYELLKNEAGIHLFYIPYATPIPVRLNIRKGDYKRSALLNYKVIRVYNQSTTLTDLRSSYTNTIAISPGEFKLLLYAGIRSTKLNRSKLV